MTRPLTVILYLLLALITVSASSHTRLTLRKRDEEPRTPRKVFLLLTTKYQRKGLDGKTPTTVEAYDQQDIRAAIYHAALEVQGDGVKHGSMRVDIDIDGYNLTPDDSVMRGLVRVRDYGLGNSIDAPVNHFSKFGLYTRAIEVGATNIGNDAILGTNGRGIVQSVWSKDTTYTMKAHNCISLTHDLMQEMGIKPPPSVAGIFEDTFDSKLMGRRHGVYEERNLPLRLEKYPPGGDMSAREYWAFDVADQNDPKLLVHSKGDTVIEGSMKVETKAIGTNVRGVEKVLNTAQEYVDFYGNNPPTENYLDKETLNYWAETDPDGPTDALGRKIPRSPFGLFDDSSDAGSDSPGSSKRALSVASETTEVAWVRSGGVVKSVISVGKASLQALGVAGSAVAALFIIVDIVNGDYKAAAFGAAGIAAAGIGIALDLLVAGPIGTIVGLVAGILLAM